jgi:outer membrane immunogenic protein
MKRLAFAVTALVSLGKCAGGRPSTPYSAAGSGATFRPRSFCLQLGPDSIWRQSWRGLDSGGSVSDTFNSTPRDQGQTTKFIGGGQVGWNYEFYSGVVIGAEAMFDWLPNTTNTFNVTGGGPALGSTASATLNSRWLTTVTGKLGYAWNTVLLYGKGGGAWVGSTAPGAVVEPAQPPVAPPAISAGPPVSALSGHCGPGRRGRI